MGERTSIKDVFVQCQTGMQSHGKLISTLSKIYDKVSHTVSSSDFIMFVPVISPATA